MATDTGEFDATNRLLGQTTHAYCKRGDCPSCRSWDMIVDIYDEPLKGGAMENLLNKATWQTEQERLAIVPKGEIHSTWNDTPDPEPVPMATFDGVHFYADSELPPDVVELRGTGGVLAKMVNVGPAEPAPESLRIERAKMLIETGKTAHILSPEAEEEFLAAMQEQIERDCQEILGPYFYVGGPMTVSWSEPSDWTSWDLDEKPDLSAITRDIARGG